jgi:hypothetical protein
MTRTASRTGATALAAALAAAFAAAAALPPEVYLAARREAAEHLQLRIEAVAPPPWYADHGACRVTGEVVRVFRGGHAPGDRLAIEVDCAKPRARLPDGPTLWTSWRALEEAGFIEAYLDDRGAVAVWQTMLLSEPSDAPSCAVDFEGLC